MDFVTRTVQALESPPASVFNWSVTTGEDFLTGVRDAHRLRQENARLRGVEQAAKAYQETYERMQQRLDDMNAMVGYQPPPPFTKLFASVIGYFPNENRITLDRGSASGIQPHMPVVAAYGLLGIVETVEKDKSQVLLVSSRATRVGARVFSSPDVVGIVRGETPNRLVLELFASNEVHNGDRVVTSGQSADMPGDIPIGVVVEVIDDPQFGTKRVFVLPYAHMGSINEVYVLK